MIERTDTLPEYSDAIPRETALALFPSLNRRFSAQARLLASHSLSAVIAQVLRAGIGLAIIPITLTYLGKERYGLWMLVLSTLSLIGLLDAGLAPTLKNKMAESFARQDEDAFHYYASGGLLLACVVLLIGLCLLPFLLLIDWSWVYGVAGQVPRAEAQGLTLACFVVSLLSVALSFVEAMFAARMQLGTVYVFNSVASVVGLGAAVAAVHLHAGVAVLAVTVSAPQIVARLILLASANHRGMIRFSAPTRRVRSLLRSVLPNSASFLGIKVLEAVIGAVPNLVASRLSGLSTVAVLMVGMRVTTLPLIFVAAIVPVFWPVFTIAWVKGDLERIRKQYVPMVGATAILLGLYACACVLIGPLALKLWLHGSLSVPRPILGVLGIWLVLQGVCYWVSTLLHSISDLNVQVVCYALQALITAVLGALLCRAYGPLGITVSMTIALAVANLAPLGWRVYCRLSSTQRDCCERFGHDIPEASCE